MPEKHQQYIDKPEAWVK